MMRFQIGLIACSALLIGGCGMMRGRGEQPSAPRTAYAPPAAETTPGAIFQAGHDVAYFEDLKAKRVGDVLTIRLQESTAASKSANTKTSKEGTTSISAPTIAGQGVTHNGTPILSNSLDGSRDFDGQGSSSQSNSLEGSVTVTVVERLPNGNLVIEGDKWLTLNQGDELVKISGVVRPFDIAPDNTITSDKVADARIRYSGRGALASSNKAGWLARFFNSPLFPY